VYLAVKGVAAPVLLVVAGLTFSFLVVETGLRLIGFDPMGSLAEGRQLILQPSENPLRKFELSPNSMGVAWQTDVRINSHGMRDLEYPVARTGAPRIAVIGDSVTFGNAVAEADRFTEQLESLLSGRLRRPVEVMNFGVGGYDTLQEVATLEDLALPFAPDLVIVGYCMNDLGDTSPNLGYIRRLRQANSRVYRLRTVQLVSTAVEKLGLIWRLGRTNRDALFAENNRAFITSVSGDRELLTLRDRLAERMRSAEEDDLILSWYRSEAHLGKLAYAFDRLAGVARTNDMMVLVAILPFLEASDGYELAYRMVHRLAVSRGLAAVVLAPRLPSAELESLRSNPRDPVHPNARGHRLIAEALLPVVSEMLSALDAGPGSESAARESSLQ